jgi:hypothetical protein
MKYPDHTLPATMEVTVDFSAGIRKKAEAKKLGSAERNNLPDSDFAYIEPGGEKDEEGKTTPRSLRHLPINDAAHVRNALARLNQTDIPAEAKAQALKKIKSKAKELGLELPSLEKSDESKAGLTEQQKKLPPALQKVILKKMKKSGKKDEKTSKKENKEEKDDGKEKAEAMTTKEYDKIDKKELKQDTPKQKVSHEKDAIKDDKYRIKKDKKGAPSAKKQAEVKDLKKDIKFDKKSEQTYEGKAADTPKIAFKPAPFDGTLESAPYSKLLEPTDWEKLKKELGMNNLWFKKAEAPSKDYKKYLDPNFTP